MRRGDQLKLGRTIAILISLITAGSVTAADLSPWFGDLSFLKADEVIIAMLASMVLLLLGVLFRLRHFRVALQHKTEALEKRERQMRLMGDHLPNVTVFQLERVNDAFRFTYLSKSYERALGLDRDPVYADARIAYDHVYEEDLPLLQEAFQAALSSGKPADFELRALDAGGALKWLHISAVPEVDLDEIRWDGFMHDITESKRVEDALVEENQNFQNLFDTIDDLLLVCDLNGQLIHANPSVVNRLEYDLDELRDMSVFELYPEASREKIYQLVARMRGEPSATCAEPFRAKSGASIPVEMNVFQGDWKSSPVLFAVARDVASRQETESALRESQQMLQLIMDTIPMSVFWKDQHSVYLGCNKTFIRECGLERLDEVVGKNPYDLYDSGMAPEVVERDQTVLRENRANFGVIRSQPIGDGKFRFLEISKIPLRDDKGRAVGVLGVRRDVTEQNRAEERLKRTLEDMERFNQLMRGRERRTLELKAEINGLLKELGRAEKYRTTTKDLK